MFNLRFTKDFLQIAALMEMQSKPQLGPGRRGIYTYQQAMLGSKWTGADMRKMYARGDERVRRERRLKRETRIANKVFEAIAQ